MLGWGCTSLACSGFFVCRALFWTGLVVYTLFGLVILISVAALHGLTGHMFQFY